MEENILLQITQKPATYHPISSDLLMLELPMVNVFMIGKSGETNDEWVLIGAGTPHTSSDIIMGAKYRFGKNTPPRAIILSHGHYDHVGAILELLYSWGDIPIFAHKAELPYLTGQKDYPPPDPAFSNGLIAKISPLFPHKSINLSKNINELPVDHTVPFLPDFKWIHTPGHSPGHVSFFREKDKLLIAGDAITTIKQDSAESVYLKDAEINGPPGYFTMDWDQAETSVRLLKSLMPKVVLSSHGLPMKGSKMISQLNILSENFSYMAVPEHKKYMH